METNVYPREHEQLKRLREETFMKHPAALMGVPPEEAQFLAIMPKVMIAKKTIELGVFTGYSLLATALALPKDGKITAIDISQSAFKIGLPFIKEAGVIDKINFIESEALPVLNKMLQEVNGDESLFDFAFVDADKRIYGKYHDRLAELVKVGGVVACDNTLWLGSVATPDDPTLHPMFKDNTPIMIEFNKKLAADSRFEISQLPVGDGLSICRRVSVDLHVRRPILAFDVADSTPCCPRPVWFQ